MGISDKGQAVGYVVQNDTFNTDRAVMWTQETIVVPTPMGSVAASVTVVPTATTKPGLSQQYVYLPLVRQQPVFGSQPETATPVQTISPTPSKAPSPTAKPSTNCDAAYPTICIPPPPPDLDCPNITERNFSVPVRDLHRFDTDNDGIGFET